MTSPLNLAIFDFDGTLADSHYGLHVAFEMAFESMGLALPTVNETRKVVGLRSVTAIERLAPEADGDTALAIAHAFVNARDRQRQAGEFHDRLYDGAVDILDRLEERGVLLAVATNKARKSLEYSLERHDLQSYFVTTRTADDGPAKPHPDMVLEILRHTGVDKERAVMIGDTAMDIETAINAGITAIGVGWGYYDEPMLTKAGAHKVVHHFTELDGALDAIWSAVPV